MKSRTEPRQWTTVLGFIINSILMIVTLTPEKATAIKQLWLCVLLSNSSAVTIRFLAKVIGKIVATFTGVHYGQLHSRQLECTKIKALKWNKGNFDAYVSVTLPVREDLQWWIDTVETIGDQHCRSLLLCYSSLSYTSSYYS